MKKTIKPNTSAAPLALLLPVLLVLIVFSGILVIGETGLIIFAILIVIAIGIGVALFRYCKNLKRAEFDEETFTVKGKTYNIDDISKVAVEPNYSGRHSAVIGLEVYVNDRHIFTFYNEDVGAKEFIGYMENHGKHVTVDTY